MFAPRSWRTVTVAAGLAALAACAGEAPSPVAPVLPSEASLAMVRPAAVGEGELWICKVANAQESFTFTYSMVNDLGQAGPSGSVTVASNTCVLAASVDKVTVGPVNRWRATVTEAAPPAYWSLSGISVTYTGSFNNTPVIDLANRSVSNIRLANDLGGTATFTNTYTPPTGKIGDYVWYDVDGDGVQESGETGIAGVQVTLSGPVNTSTTTDANGGYLFTGLPAGSYTVTVATPTGYVASPSGQGGDPAMDSNGSPASVTLATNSSEDLTIDFGYTKYLGKIGDYVWDDANGNGLQDSGEAGIAGVQVTLGGAASSTATTDANGYYLFSNLAAGSYTVTVGAPPANYVATLANQGSNDAIDSDGTAPVSVTLASNTSEDLTIDFGFIAPRGRIGDFVWSDTNGNGVQDSGEAGIAGVLVTLGGAASATTTTDANGFYLFSNLAAGSYTVTVGTPSGYSASPSNQGGDPSKDSNGSPASVTLATNLAQDLTIDFGFVRLQGPACTLTQGYWKTHPEDWDSVADGKPFITTSTFYNSGTTYLALMNTPPKGGNAYIQLAHQFIAARLNTNNGPSGVAAVDAALAGAAAYFTSAPAGIPSPSGSLRTQLLAWMTTLDNYNNGLTGPGHCN